MITLVYFFISICVCFLSTMLFKSCVGFLSVLRLNMVSWVFYYNIIIQSFFAALLTITHLDNHYIISKAGESARFCGWLSVMYIMLALPASMLLINRLSGIIVKNRFKRYLKTKINFKTIKSEYYVRYCLYGLSIVSVLAVIYTFVSLKEIPVFGLLQGLSASELAALRQQASRNFSGIEYIRNIFGIVLSPILTYIAFAYYSSTKNKKDLYWFIIQLISSIFILTYDLSKGPIIEFLIGFVLCLVLLNGKISKKLFGIVAILCLVLLLISYCVVAKVNNVSDLFGYNSGIVGRLILSQAGGTYLSFQYFPEKHDFIGFNSMSRVISAIFNLDYEPRAARVIMEIFNPSGVKDGTAGVMNSLFVAEAWANWGIAGVILSPIVVGFVIQFIIIFFITHKKTPLMVGLFTYLSLKMPVTGGINDFIYNSGLIIIFSIFILVGVIARRLRAGRTGRLSCV